jgi:hypothetical protein
MASGNRYRTVAAVCGLLVGPLVLVPWVLAAVVQPDEFSLVNHPSSDLGADTAPSAWISNQLGSNLPGLLLTVFGLGLWQALGPSRTARAGSALVIASGIGVFLSGFLTLDCREIDATCENSSWQAGAHVAVTAPALLALAAAPFVLARALRRESCWSDLARPSLAVGVAALAGFVFGSAIGEGLGQMLPIAIWVAWIAVLAMRMLRLARAKRPEEAGAQPSAA